MDKPNSLLKKRIHDIRLRKHKTKANKTKTNKQNKDNNNNKKTKQNKTKKSATREIDVVSVLTSCRERELTSMDEARNDTRDRRRSSLRVDVRESAMPPAAEHHTCKQTHHLRCQQLQDEAKVLSFVAPQPSLGLVSQR